LIEGSVSNFYIEEFSFKIKKKCVSLFFLQLKKNNYL